MRDSATQKVQGPGVPSDQDVVSTWYNAASGMDLATWRTQPKHCKQQAQVWSRLACAATILTRSSHTAPGILDGVQLLVSAHVCSRLSHTPTSPMPTLVAELVAAHLPAVSPKLVIIQNQIRMHVFLVDERHGVLPRLNHVWV